MATPQFYENKTTARGIFPLAVLHRMYYVQW
jgi:hypothetical protein